MTNSSPWYRWPIERDDFPILRPPFILGIFHGYVAMLNNQMVVPILPTAPNPLSQGVPPPHQLTIAGMFDQPRRKKGTTW